jgi:hypothetical protein
MDNIIFVNFALDCLSLVQRLKPSMVLVGIEGQTQVEVSWGSGPHSIFEISV